jgi:hypothetical protein
MSRNGRHRPVDEREPRPTTLNTVSFEALL